jgi:pyruvate dehydrogenase E2 component (dihydrolipoamide acetyltransferase)
VAQRVAAVAGVDPETLAGTGPRGRVTKADVERLVQNDQTANTQPTTTPISTPFPALADMEVLESIPLKGTRGIIAERMGASVHTTARVTLVMEVDATEFVKMRERLKDKVSEQWGFAPGYNDLIAKITATALKKFPYMNARLTADAIQIIKPINIGMAVDTERGLLVPVIREADKKSLRMFGSEFRQLVERSRNRKSLPDDLTGGTFTITNLGAYDVDAFTPVINLPEAAILGVGRIAPKAVVVKDVVVARTMCTLSLVFDHRLVDGAPAARFLQYIKELMEEPYLWISELQEA